MELNNITLDKISTVAEAILAYKTYTICLINGEMGSGKTTLIREICQVLEVEDNVASPTFSLVNEYASKQGAIYHFDFYRLNSVGEALDAGVEEYFYSDQLCLIEWPELIQPILPPKYLNVDIDNTAKDIRNYKLTTHESD
jgi:tRNA threonylcarbamoyladenosine biosynthesis protein TsaE